MTEQENSLPRCLDHPQFKGRSRRKPASGCAPCAALAEAGRIALLAPCRRCGGPKPLTCKQSQQLCDKCPPKRGTLLASRAKPCRKCGGPKEYVARHPLCPLCRQVRLVLCGTFQDMGWLEARRFVHTNAYTTEDEALVWVTMWENGQGLHPCSCPNCNRPQTQYEWAKGLCKRCGTFLTGPNFRTMVEPLSLEELEKV